MNNRLQWIDIAKGILIVLVVLGHSGIETGNPIFISKLIYWFHMPAFFIISGILFKPVASWEEFSAFIKKRTLNLIIPFYIYLTLAALYGSMHFLISKDYVAFSKRFIIYMLGGNFSGYIFWFVTCLFLTQVFFALLHLIFKKSFVFLTIIFCYLLAHFDSSYLHLVKFPWSANVVLITLYYFAIGFYGKNLINHKFVKLFSVLASVLLIITGCFGLINYQLDLAQVHYQHLILDAIIPVLLSIMIFAISNFIEKLTVSKFISRIGTVSLVIMYLHFPLYWIVKHFVEYGPTVYTITGVIIPALLTTLLIERYSITKRLFLGLTQQPFKASVTKNIPPGTA